MKNKKGAIASKLWLIAVLTVIISGCAMFNKASVSYVNNRQSVARGQSVEYRVSGKEVTVSVSSTQDGSGRVASGTGVINNRLTVDLDEPADTLYVIAYSAKEGNTDVKAFRVVSVDSIDITPRDGTAVASRTLQFAANVTGRNNPDKDVTWKVGFNSDGSGATAAGTSINASGLLSVARSELRTVLYVTATSVVDPTKSSVVPVNIVVPTVTSVTVTPANPSLQRGETFQFTAAVAGTYEPDQSVTWKVSTNAAGTGAVGTGTSINAQGLLTIAGSEPASTLFITATSTFDTTKSATVISHEILAPKQIDMSMLVGTWYQHAEIVENGRITFYQTTTYVLRANGTGDYTNDYNGYVTNKEITSWTVENNTLVFTNVHNTSFDGRPYTDTRTDRYPLQLNGNSLTFTYPNTGFKDTFTRK